MALSSEDRVRKGAEKLTKMLAAKQQGRLDGFFTSKPKDGSSPIKGGNNKSKTKATDTKGSKTSGTKRKASTCHLPPKLRVC